MTKEIQKNRYIELDGTPVGANGWQKNLPTRLSLAFTAIVTALCVNYADEFPQHEDEPEEIPPAYIVEAALLGVVLSRITKLQEKDVFEKRFGKYIIDKNPDKNQVTVINASDENEIKNLIKYYGYFPSALAVGCAGLTPVAPPFVVGTLYNSLSYVYCSRKISEGKWDLIPRSDLNLN